MGALFERENKTRIRNQTENYRILRYLTLLNLCKTYNFFFKRKKKV